MNKYKPCHFFLLKNRLGFVRHIIIKEVAFVIRKKKRTHGLGVFFFLNFFEKHGLSVFFFFFWGRNMV